MNTLINQRAGENPSGQWFYRNCFDYGKGLQGINLKKKFTGRELSARLFPKMLLQQQWLHPFEKTLVDTFIHWLSPYLLTLDLLTDSQRLTLEQAARQYALAVDKMYPLYPKVLDEQAINAARIEAVMRRSNQINNRDKTAEAIEYIETQHSLV